MIKVTVADGRVFLANGEGYGETPFEAEQNADKEATAEIAFMLAND